MTYLGRARSRGRRLAAETLGKIGDRRAVAPLISLLSDNHKWVRCAAARALGDLGDRRALGPLFKALLRQRSARRYLDHPLQTAMLLTRGTGELLQEPSI